MTFVSYAQNYEDVALWRALRDVEGGFYVDVGAADPTIRSVTKAFYERGWSGINIEPTEPYFTALQSERPRDINLRVLAGARAGVRTLYVIEGTELSTLNKEFATRHIGTGFESRELVVPELQLNQLLEMRAGLPIHFLKIDVEGAETDVLSGIDLTAFRPWIILVEATEPNSQKLTRHLWENLLVDRGYEFVYFDGLNCFYTAVEHANLREKLALPPNVFDEFVPVTEVRLQDDLVQQTRRAEELIEAQAAAATEIARLETKVGVAQATVATEIARLETKVGEAQATVATEIARLETKVGEAQATAATAIARLEAKVGEARHDLHTLSSEIDAVSNAVDDLRKGSRVLEERSVNLERLVRQSVNDYHKLVDDHTNTVRELNELRVMFSISQSRAEYILNRSVIEKLFFRVIGRPIKPLRRLLFHNSGKPRGLFRIFVLHKNGKPRKAFSYWLKDKEPDHSQYPEAVATEAVVAQGIAAEGPVADAVAAEPMRVTTPRERYFLARLLGPQRANN